MTIRDIALDVALNLDHSGMVIAITEEDGHLMGWYTHNSTIQLKGEIARIPLGLEYYDVLLESYDVPRKQTYAYVSEQLLDCLVDDLTPVVEAFIRR